MIFWNIFTKDAKRFSSMLTMEPEFSQIGLKFKAKLSQEDILAMREDIGKNFGKIQVILKQVPNYMLLVFR